MTLVQQTFDETRQLEEPLLGTTCSVSGQQPLPTATMNTAEEAMQKSTYNKMVDFKKKISLLEGKRKAIYTKFEKEKYRNKMREEQLGGEIINAHKDYIRSLTTDEALLSNVPKYPNLNTKVLERLSPNSAVLREGFKLIVLD